MQAKDVGDPKAEIARLKAKMGAIQDRDIRAALQSKIDELQAKADAAKAVAEAEEEAKEPEAPPPPPTPEQAEQAERLVRQAMLEKQRGNKAAVTKLLQEAVEIAPGAPATLEALGDDLADRNRAKEALDCYRRALALDPKNLGLDRKHATLVYKVGNLGSIEDQLRANLSDSPLLSASDGVASYGVAKFVSYFFPGLGHVLLGRSVMGFGLLAAWVGCLLWIILVRSAGGATKGFNTALVPPLAIGAVVLLVAVGTLGSDRAAARSKKATPRPKPPVNLPFD